MTTTIILLLLSLQYQQAVSFGIVAHRSNSAVVPYVTRYIPLTRLHSTSTPGDDNDQDDDTSSSEEGASLAADFFKALGERNIELDEGDFLDDDDDDDDDEDDDDEQIDEETVRDTANDSDDNEDEESYGDEDEINIPDGAIKAFTDFDETTDNVTLTNEEVYSALKERVLESAGAFIDLVGGADDGDDKDDGEADTTNPKIYVTPKTVPDSGLTAGEVVTTVLDALCNNDTPTNDRGIEVLFGYSSPGSIISQAIEVEGMTPMEYGEFLKEDIEYQVLFNHTEVIIDKGDYSFDKKKSFFTARLRTGEGSLDFTSVNFILSTNGQDEDDCWLIDSLLIRPESMRRGRRR